LKLPIFPLSTVLFPGGSLPLRVFEARYMEMAKACLSTGSRFGVCVITSGKEVGGAATHEMVGCEAQIKDWDMQQLGILQIRAMGTRRFQVLSTIVQASGLIEAEVEFLEAEPDQVLPEEFVPLAALTQRIILDLVKRSPEPIQKLVEAPYQYASASWVGQRLCEFLPIPNPIKHQLMHLSDPIGRLKLVKHFLEQQGVIKGSA
jgi:uncharacterized protein